MIDFLVLNDASLPFSSANDCEQNMGVFFSILHRANSQGIRFYRADNLEGSWNSLIYADGFDIGKWINSITNRDQSLLVKSVISNVKCPLASIDDIHPHNSMNEMLFVLSSNKNIEVQGLGVASQTNTHGISFASHPNWTVNPIVVVKQWDEDGATQEIEVEVPNVYSLAHIDNVLTKLHVKKQLNRKYLCSLMTLGNKDFPNLIFCETALKGLSSISITFNEFQQIIKVLTKLNDSICDASNRDELVKRTELKISGESAETMNTPKHARKRLFKHPILGRISFEDHVKNFPCAKRMHIFSDYANNNICIGYFGRHLTNVTNPKS